MTGAAHSISIPHRTADAQGSDHSITDEEDSAGVHIGRSRTTSQQSSAGEYSEESAGEEGSEEEDTWTDLSKDLGPSQSAFRPASSSHHRVAETQHRTRREDDRLPHRPRQARRRSPTPPGSVDSGEEQYAGPAADIAIRPGGTYYTYTPQQAVQGQPYATYQQTSPEYAPYQQPQHVMAYGQRQPVQYPYSPYQQHHHGSSHYPFPPQPRMTAGYGHEVAYPASTPYNHYMSYPMPALPAQPAPQPIHYHYPPVYTPPPANPTPPAAAPAAAATAAAAAAADADAYEDLKKMLLADKADREAREKAAKQAEEEKLAALEAAKKRAEDIAKAAETAAADAKTEAEKIAAEEQKKLKAEAEEAAAKAKADAEAAAKKYEEEKEAAVKAAAAAAAIPAEKQKPIKFKDAVGRKFSFPFHLCRTWEGMEDLIRQAFLHVDVIGPHVVEGHYDLIGPNSEIILPGVWETVIEPDWTITMHMWPVPEKEEIDIIEVPPIGPEPPVDDKKKGKKAVKKGGFFLFGGPAKPKGKGKASIAAAAAAAAGGKK